MCGIAGYIQKKYENDTYSSVLKMMDSQIHRGPDDNGVCGIDIDASRLWAETYKENINGYLGFDRLSIQDLSANGHQPMIENKVVLIYNGEIYNGAELKNVYLQDCIFKSTSDTEIILKMYLKYGIEKTLDSLNGMFGLAIVDLNNNYCYLSRDRIGIKPLYFYYDENKFLFASELKGILGSGVVTKILNKRSYYENLMFGYSYGGETLLQDINEVLPGTYWKINLSSFTYSEIRYWNMLDEIYPKTLLSYQKAKKELNDKLYNVVKNQMISDVKVGCQLSGGIDSSLITWYMSKISDEAGRQNCLKEGIGVIPSDPALSEEKWMNIVAEKTNLKVYKVQLKEETIVNEWREAIWHLDGIPAFINELGIKALAREAHRHLTVLLSGEGADELLCYPRMAEVNSIIWKCKIVNKLGINDTLARKYLHFNKNFYDNQKSNSEIVSRYLLMSGDGVSEQLFKKLCGNFYDEKQYPIYEKRLKKLNELMNTKISKIDVSRCYELSVRISALLNRQDKMTMAYSIENRVPFLDNEIISYALSMPERYLIKHKRVKWRRNPFAKHSKYILKDLAKDIFGEDFAFRKKEGFPVALKNYLQEFVENDEFDIFLTKLLSRNMIDGGVLKDYIKTIKEHGHFDDVLILLWRCFSLELFTELFIDESVEVPVK